MIAMEIFSLGVLPVDGLSHDVHNGMQSLGQVTVDLQDNVPPSRPKFELIVDVVDTAPPPRPKFELIVDVMDNNPPPRPK